MKKSNLPEILACLVVLLGATYFIRVWKIKKDRAACIINIRNVQQATRGYLGMHQGSHTSSFPAEQIWNDIFTGPDRYLDMPKCPSGGTYTFPISNTLNPPLGEVFCKCSHAETLGHVPDHTSDW